LAIQPHLRQINSGLRFPSDRRRHDLRFSNLRFSDVGCADVRFANLWFADVWFADVWFADVWFADVWFSDRRAFAVRAAAVGPTQRGPLDLRFAYLWFADFRFADFWSTDLWFFGLWFFHLGSTELGFAEWAAIIRANSDRIAKQIYFMRMRATFTGFTHATARRATLAGNNDSTGRDESVRWTLLAHFPVDSFSGFLQSLFGCLPSLPQFHFAAPVLDGV
jgi:hypothetical protein